MNTIEHSQKIQFEDKNRCGMVIDASQGASLEDLGVRLLPPGERKDYGGVEYIETVSQAVQQWSKDPYGAHVARFLTEAYGVPQDQIRDVLTMAGMEEYMTYKSEGRFIGMVACQIFKPTHYFLSNARVLGELSRRGVPTAFMAMEYPTDTFYAANSDKKTTFDPVDFIVGVTQDKTGKSAYETVQIRLQPYAVREDDGTMRRVRTIDELNGYRCSDIYVQMTHATGPGKNSAKNFFTIESVQQSKHKAERVTVYPEAALGFSSPGLITSRISPPDGESILEESLSLTDFYRELWKHSIAHMRAVGDLPSEEEMPMFFVDAKQLYSTIAMYSQPSEETLRLLNFSVPPKDILKHVFVMSDHDMVDICRDLQISEYKEDTYESVLAYVLSSRGLYFDAQTGLLMNTEQMMDPASYYPFQKLWPDLYLECSSCGGEYFVGKVKRAAAVTKHYGVPNKQIRLPDTEIPALEEYCIHPGSYTNLNPTDERYISVLARVSRRIDAIKKNGKDPYVLSELETLRNEVRLGKSQALRHVLEHSNLFQQSSNIVIPAEVAAFHRHILEGLDELFEDLSKKFLESV